MVFLTEATAVRVTVSPLQTVWATGLVVTLRVVGAIEVGHNSTTYPPALLLWSVSVSSVNGLSEVTTTFAWVYTLALCDTFPPVTVSFPGTLSQAAAFTDTVPPQFTAKVTLSAFAALGLPPNPESHTCTEVTGLLNVYLIEGCPSFIIG